MHVDRENQVLGNIKGILLDIKIEIIQEFKF